MNERVEETVGSSLYAQGPGDRSLACHFHQQRKDASCFIIPMSQLMAEAGDGFNQLRHPPCSVEGSRFQHLLSEGAENRRAGAFLQA